jgi:hypothetical protein
VAAYRADIEIGVKGAGALKELQDRVTRLSRAVEDANVKTLIDRQAIQSVNEYTSVLNKAAETLKETAVQLNAAGKASGNYADAISQYVTAIGQANQIQRIQNELIADEIELRRKQKLAQSGIRETTQYAGPIGPGQASAVNSLVGQKSPVAERVQRTLQSRQEETALQEALLALEKRSADVLNEKVQAQQNLVQGTREVLELLAEQERKARFLAGASGQAVQGPLPPLAQAGAMGFPVALSMTAAEKQSLELNTKKQAILDRIATTKRQLNGLAENLQRLDQNSVVAIADAERAQENLNESKQKTLKLTERQLSIEKQGALVAGRFSPIGGREDIAGSPAALAAGRARRTEALSNAVIGGAFPLLFGQGPGAALGGGLGGAAGGLAGGQFGFGLSLVGTALGQAFDTLITKSTELGGALLKVSETFNTLKERSLISNREREKELQVLQDAGFAASANAAAQEELFKTIGARGVDSLRELGSESDRLNRTWAELSVQLQAVVAGPLADFASVLNQFFKPSAIAGRVEALRQDLNPQDRQKLNEELRVLATKGTFRPTGALNRTQLEALATFKPEQVQQALDKFGKLRVNADVKLDPEQARQEFVSILQKQLEVIDIVSKFEQANERQQELDRQRFDLIEGYEESIAAIRRRVEDEVTNKRLALIQKENELLDTQAQIRQESLSIANQQAVSAAGAGLPTQARDAARTAAEAAGTFQEQELSIAEQSAKLKRDSALEALRTDIQAARFQAETAREVSRLNIDTARRVADINAGIRKQNAQQDVRRFEIEKQISLVRLQIISQEFGLLAGQAAPTPDVQSLQRLQTFAQQGFNFAVDAEKRLREAKAPAPLREIGAVGGQGVSTAALNTLTEKLKEAESAAVSAQLAVNDLLALKNQEQFKAKISALAESIEAPFDNLDEEIASKAAERQRFAQLIKEGVRGVVAERIIEIEKLENIAVLQFDAAIAELEKKRAIEGTNKALEDQIKVLEERRDAIAGRAAGAVTKTKEQESPAKRLQDAAIKAREELAELVDISNQVANAAKSIGEAFSQSFIDLVSGTASAQQALSNFFKSVGEAFLETANQIIAKLIEIYILETIVGLISGAVAPSSGTSSASKAISAGKGAIKGFAEGGFVTRPTRALIGEGGSDEYVIPANKMAGAMQRYNAGVRGEAVLKGASSTEQSGGFALINQPTQITISGGVMQFNDTNYIRQDQVPAIVDQASRAGEARALRKLQQSPSARRKIGM